VEEKKLLRIPEKYLPYLEREMAKADSKKFLHALKNEQP
jgi:hypothetical protein